MIGSKKLSTNIHHCYFLLACLRAEPEDPWDFCGDTGVEITGWIARTNGEGVMDGDVKWWVMDVFKKSSVEEKKMVLVSPPYHIKSHVGLDKDFGPPPKSIRIYVIWLYLTGDSLGVKTVRYLKA